jgi:hypothetical protein
MNNMNNQCTYILRPGKGWSVGKDYHTTALNLFLQVPYNLNNPVPVRIEFPHPDGGNFVGLFRRISNNKSHSEYINESGQRVEIMICEPSYAAYINRIIDY